MQDEKKGPVAFELHAGDVGELKNLRGLVEKHQVVVIRNLPLTCDSQIEVTALLGQPEQAWEDKHPSSKFLQLMDSRTQIKIDRKSSSKYWHLDRSFMPHPTRFTCLHAVKVGPSARGTQFIDARNLYARLSNEVRAAIRNLDAVHDFSLHFPDVMEAKGYEERRIGYLKGTYPPSKHPLVRMSEYGDSLYYSELCVGRVLGVSKLESEKILEKIQDAVARTDQIYEHIWKPHDTLIWDNYSTIHRARPDGTQGLRVLTRSTAS